MFFDMFFLDNTLICGYMGNLMGTHVEPPAILVCKKICPFGMILSGGIPQSVQTVNA